MHIFFSYTSTDEKLARQFLSHLSSLSRQEGVHIWHQGKMMAGENRQSFITSQLQIADLILLFISADFLSSSSCYTLDIQQALTRHQAGMARVVPILVRPVGGWEQSLLGQLQAVPRDGRPITTWRNRDLAWVKVAEQILEIFAAFSSLDPRKPELQQQPGGLIFARITLAQNQTGWCNSDESGFTSLAHPAYILTFALCNPLNGSDPVFDITLLNTTPDPLIINRIGLEIVSVDHHVSLSLRPIASKIPLEASYILPMPDILTQDGPFGDGPITLNRQLGLDLPDPIFLPPGSPYRYVLQLQEYCQHMPWKTSLHMWVHTSAGSVFSALLHLSLE